jgi:hypothetical protein
MVKQWSIWKWLAPFFIVGLLIVFVLDIPIKLPFLGHGSSDRGSNMTFSCHGDRIIERFSGIGKPEIKTEKVSHSITFWRTSNDELQQMRSLSRYKTTKYALDGSIVNLFPSNKIQFVDTERLGFISIRDDSNSDPVAVVCGPKGCSVDKNYEFNARDSISFDFVTMSLRIFKSEMNWNKVEKSGTPIRYTTDYTQCQRVTDPASLEELSVIRWWK